MSPLPFLLALALAGEAAAPPGDAPAPALAVRIDQVIVRDGPGAWARHAYWDEYVVSLQPAGTGPLLMHAELVGWLGETVPASDHYTTLWHGTEAARQRYDQVGVLLALDTPMRLTTVLGSFGRDGGFVFGRELGASRSPPDDRQAAQVQAGIEQRTPPLPYAIDQAVTLSLFFPVTPGPKWLRLHLDGRDGGSVLDVPLPESLSRLHLSPRRPAGKARVRPRD